VKIDGRILSHETSEAIRRMAVKRVLEGEAPSAVMKSYGLCRTTIYPWLRAHERGGETLLKSRVSTLSCNRTGTTGVEFLSGASMLAGFRRRIRHCGAGGQSFCTDVFLDPGRAAVPRITALLILRSTFPTVSAPAMRQFRGSIDTHAIAVYALWPSLPPAHATLTAERPATVLLGPASHRLDRASHTGTFGKDDPQLNSLGAREARV
jgi:hypothetical protein